MKLWIAAEACFEGGFDESWRVAGLALRFVLLEEALHALSVAKVDDGKACLLLEESAQARRAKPRTVGQLIKAVH